MARTEQLRQVIAGCQAGDAEAFSKLVDIYATRCYGYFYRLTGNADVSDELLSELFVRLVEKIATYKGGAFESWLFRIASNIFHDYLRSKTRYQRALEARFAQCEKSTTEPKKSEMDLTDRLQRQLEKLDPNTRELIILRFYSEMSLKEIAALRSEPIGTTLSRLHRGLRRLREMME